MGADEGEPLGIVSIRRSQLRWPKRRNVDLVEIAPLAKPPVARLMDYGKFKYQEQKKAHEARLKQKQIQVKEVKFRPGTDDGDYKIKLRNLIRVFLRKATRPRSPCVSGAARWRTRSSACACWSGYPDRPGSGGAGRVECPKLEGRQMVMVLAPKKKVIPVIGTPAKTGA